MDTAHYRTLLEERLEALQTRDRALQKHLRGQDGRADQDFADRVAYTEMDEVLEGLDEAGREEIAAIRGALERLDAGEYGVCTKCGEDVGTRRLDVLPHTPFCVACA